MNIASQSGRDRGKKTQLGEGKKKIPQLGFFILTSFGFSFSYSYISGK